MIDMPTVYEDLIRYMRLLEKHDEAIQVRIIFIYLIYLFL